MKKDLNLYFVLAGAVSAGAYTAGVLETIMDKIDAYSNDGSAKYNIKIRGIAGASAGGMCGSILLRTFHGAQDWNNAPKRDLQRSTWVDKITLTGFSTFDDIKDGKVYSLLNGNLLKRTAIHIFEDVEITNAPKLPSFVADDFELILSVTDTRGLSYPVQFVNDNGTKPYFLTNHRHYFDFSYKKLKHKDSFVLNDRKVWDQLRSVSLGTGAFPLGFPPIRLDRTVLDGDSLVFDAPDSKITVEPLEKELGKYSYLGVDGGTVDNEPLNKVMEMILARKKSDDEHHKVIFIDPFPTIEEKYSDDMTLGHQIGRLYSVLRNQSVFKPDEIEHFFTHHRNDCFMIAPKRKGTSEEDLQVAGGAFGAFSGFVHKSFREFDYQLGRRNSQRFIGKHFTVDGETVFSTVGDTVVKELPWPAITNREYKQSTKGLKKRMSKVLKGTLGGFTGSLVGLFVKNKPAQLIKQSLAENKLIQ